jgi:hypothetical protein
MKKVIHLLTSVSLILLLNLLLGCGGSMTKDQAIDFIMKKYQIPSISGGINKQILKSKTYVQYTSFPKVSITIGDDKVLTYKDYEPFLSDLAKKGLITIEEFTTQDYDYNEDRTYVKIMLTDEGKKYLIKEYSTAYELDLPKLVYDKLCD